MPASHLVLLLGMAPIDLALALGRCWLHRDLPSDQRRSRHRPLIWRVVTLAGSAVTCLHSMPIIRRTCWRARCSRGELQFAASAARRPRACGARVTGSRASAAKSPKPRIQPATIPLHMPGVRFDVIPSNSVILLRVLCCRKKENPAVAGPGITPMSACSRPARCRPPCRSSGAWRPVALQ
jgi:hypothetical protein